jgi:hypothetical protein
MILKFHHEAKGQAARSKALKHLEDVAAPIATAGARAFKTMRIYLALRIREIKQKISDNISRALKCMEESTCSYLQHLSGART